MGANAYRWLAMGFNVACNTSPLVLFWLDVIPGIVCIAFQAFFAGYVYCVGKFYQSMHHQEMNSVMRLAHHRIKTKSENRLRKKWH